MKKILILVTFLFSTYAFSELQIINCLSQTNKGNALVLVINNLNIKEMRISDNIRRPFYPTRVSTQNPEKLDTTFFNIPGFDVFLEVQNKVLDFLPGYVTFLNETYFCR
jgi:hypothetical protein